MTGAVTLLLIAVSVAVSLYAFPRLGGPGEEPDGRTYPFTAVSEPVTVTLP